MTPQNLPHGQETILVVDNELAVRRITQRALEGLGYTVLTAADGAEALAVLEIEGDAIALVLTDVLMPGMNGVTLYRRVRERGFRVPVVFMSAHAEPIRRELGFERNFGILGKPWATADLALAVREALDS
jgi:CheY-like chemotaxis protein